MLRPKNASIHVRFLRSANKYALNAKLYHVFENVFCGLKYFGYLTQALAFLGEFTSLQTKKKFTKLNECVR